MHRILSFQARKNALLLANRPIRIHIHPDRLLASQFVIARFVASSDEQSRRDIRNLRNSSNIVNVRPGRLTGGNIRILLGCLQEWSRTNTEEGALEASIILRRLLQDHKRKNPELKISMHMVHLVLDAWRRSDSDLAVEQMERLIKDVEAAAVLLDIKCYSMLLDVYARHGEAKRAQRFLSQILEYSHVEPDLVSFNSVIHAWANSKEPNRAERAQELLTYMVEERGLEPNTLTFSAVLDAWSKQANPEQAQILLDRMLNLYKKRQAESGADAGMIDIKPNAICFGAVMNAWAKKGTPESSDKVQALLQQLEQLYKDTQDQDFKPTLINFNLAARSFSQLGDVEAVEEIHKQMETYGVDPDRVTFNNLIQAWSKRGDAKRAQGILNEMIERSKEREELYPDTISYSLVIDAWAKSSNRGVPSQAEALLKQMTAGKEISKPNVIAYSSLIDAWARSGRKEAGERANELVSEMMTLYKNGDKEMKPTTKIYNAAINAWSKSSHEQAAVEAEKLLKRMSRNSDPASSPNQVSYGATMDAWAKSGHEDAPEKTERLFQNMLRRYKNGHERLKPDVINFNMILHAWSRSGRSDSVEQVERLLEQCNSQYESKELRFRPNVVAYNIYLQTIAKSKDPLKARKARKVVVQMEEWDEKPNPDVRSYNLLLAACVDPLGVVEREEIFRIVANAMQKDNIKYNEYTYASFFQVCKSHWKRQPQGDNMVEEAFHECCKRALLNEVVLFEFQKAASNRLLQKVAAFSGISAFSQRKATVKDLLPEWTKNKKKKRR
eukprot:CAMPEP_0118673906 /NCGR_PEP_ID=MMETSP0800-20121206/593_1 /TAXON_ID=210618 ORGANISM="Striatella unipunctata, Strain CCMP2910" /NCGR_SAMPLE_ID=MMETSP0800 /ASSEMBLY_ACC=CAM_ASM_000638 /LENGTH=782 /DNA_ID=CAMNT_0006569043 /DNA_START=97 /DNA_END=2445 /DNA_ORIENTATION=+